MGGFVTRPEVNPPSAEVRVGPKVNTSTRQIMVQTMLENANGHMSFAVLHHLGPPGATRRKESLLLCRVSNLFSSRSSRYYVLLYYSKFDPRRARENAVLPRLSTQPRANGKGRTIHHCMETAA